MSSARSTVVKPGEISFLARRLKSEAEFLQANDLYRSAFSYERADLGVNPRLLATLNANGGSAVGVFPQDRPDALVGFTYGYLGRDKEGRTYHYSQAAVVHPLLQGRGAGRLLKEAQAEVALANGQDHMRWSFDPSMARNAHFNLNSLGATGRWFTAHFYGPGADRMTVEWDLSNRLLNSAPRPKRARHIPALAAQARWGEPFDAGGERFMLIPANISSLLPADAENVRSDIRSALSVLLGSGYVAVSCSRLNDESAIYTFTGGPSW